MNFDHLNSGLYLAISYLDWDKARELLRRHDAKYFVEYTDHYSRQNVLHHACQEIKRAPSDIIQAMINASTTSPLKRDKRGEIPLYYAIRYSSEVNIIILIGACPQAASIANNRGMTPLHLAIDKNRSSTVIHHLLAAIPTAVIATNRDGDTPFRWFFSRWNVPLRNTLDSINGDTNLTDDIILRNKYRQEKKIRDLYQTALLLLQAETDGSIEENPESLFQPLCAAINNPSCPWSFVSLILRLDPTLASCWDREGQLPIHVAAAATSSIDGELFMCSRCDEIKSSSWFLYEEYSKETICCNCLREMVIEEGYGTMCSVDKIITAIGYLLAKNLAFAQVPNREGRLPLHISIENEKSFDKELGAILRAAPKALNTRDIKTHLYPFLLAAVRHIRAGNELQKFTNCFTLLMDNPHFVFSGVPH